MKALAEKHGLRILDAPQNKISLAVDVTPLEKYAEDGRKGLAFLGCPLFSLSFWGVQGCAFRSDDASRHVVHLMNFDASFDV